MSHFGCHLQLAAAYALAMVFLLLWAQPHVRALRNRAFHVEDPAQRIALLTALNTSLEGRLHAAGEREARLEAELEAIAKAHAVLFEREQETHSRLREARAALALHVRGEVVASG